MRTTLKRGVGRGATANGSNRATVPPGPLGPVTVYRQPPPPPRRGGSLVLQIFGWAALVLCVLVGGTAAGAYLYLHESVAAVAPKSVEVKAAAKRLDVPLPGQPAIALVIGYDHRANEAKGTPSRSDTLMLVRADPGAKTISLLSFPRDLRVDIYCPGQATYRDKINAAYSDCGAQGTLETVRKLTGVPINYIVTVNFRGFRQLVDRLGGVWMDVDRRYYNNQGGPSGYAKINLQPGYQRLTGLRALDFVRFRHTDSDIYRNARQQQFVRAFKNQIDSAFSLTRLPQVIKIVTSNVEVGQGGGKNVSAKTVLSYGLLAVLAAVGARVPVADRRARGLVRPDDRPREHPDGHPRLREPGRRLAAEGDGGRARREGQATRARAARHVGDRAQRKRDRGLGLDGELPPLPTRLQDGAAAERHAGERAELRLLPNDVFFDARTAGAKAAAQKLANLFGSADVKKATTAIGRLDNGAMIAAVVGQTFHGRLASAPVDQTPQREPASVTTYGASDAVGLLRDWRRRIDFPMMVPTKLADGSSLDRERPLRAYRIDPDGKHKAIRLTYRLGTNEYWGVEMTDWDDAPVLGDRNFVRRIGGRRYELYYNGPHLHMVVLRTDGASYWVVNSLLDRLSNETMIAIAKGLRPLAKVSKSA